MKRFILLFSLALTQYVYSQESTASLELLSVQTIKKRTNYTVKIPNGYTKENCFELFEPYKEYLTLEVKNETLVVELKKEEDLNKRVFQRFLMNFRPENIHYQGKTFEIGSDILQWEITHSTN